MTNTVGKRMAILWALTFMLLYLGTSQTLAQEDSADVAIVYTTAYPGTHDDRMASVEIWLDNHDFYVAGFQFMITIGNHELIDFHTDSIIVDTIIIPIDTCTGPEPHGEECYEDSLKPTPVRFCNIDTVGSLISNFEMVECHGDTGDTNSPVCNWVETLGMAGFDSLGQLMPILPYPGGYRLLCRFGVDVNCLSDTVSDRSTAFFITPGGNSFLSNPQGELIPFRYHPGELMAWWGLPGDANGDSLVELGDVIRLIDYLYRNGPSICIPECGDANGSCDVELGDIVQLIEYLFRNGPNPKPGCWHGKMEE